MKGQLELKQKPYPGADFLSWVAVGDWFECKDKADAIRHIERNGFRVDAFTRVTVRG